MLSENKIKNVFNDFADAYVNRYMSVQKYDQELDHLYELIHKRDARVLDVACGPGNLAHYIKSKNSEFNILGIDFAPAMIEKAKSLVSNVEFEILDARSISSLKNNFDAILCGFVIPYLKDDEIESLITDSFKLLYSGGLLYISTILGDRDSYIPKSSSDGKTELTIKWMTEQSLKNILIKNGFAIELISIFEKEIDNLNADDEIVVIARKC